MEKEKVKKVVKEKINDVLKKEFRSSPKSLAKKYIAHYVNHKPDVLPGQKIWDIDSDKIDPYKEKFILLRKEAFQRLSGKTLSKLKNNYDATVTSIIIDAVINFQYAIMCEMSSKDIFGPINKGIAEIRKKLDANLKAIVVLLGSEFIDEQMKIALQEKEKAHRAILNEFGKTRIASLKDPPGEYPKNYTLTKQDHLKMKKLGYTSQNIEGMNYDERMNILSNRMHDDIWPQINPLQLTAIIDSFLTFRGGVYPFEQLRDEFVSRLHRFSLNQNIGRPRKSVLKALQIVIYTLLTTSKPRNIKSYIQWAKTLTADIINESYSGTGLPKLTTRDVDSSLHSS